ncbi:MAG: serine hydrolase [Candidatus Thorarchaeota archaeon]
MKTSVDKSKFFGIATFLVLCILFTPSFASNNPIGTFHASSEIAQDYWPTNGWQNATPESQEMDSSYLQAMLDYIDDNNLPIDAILIVRNGYLVFEEYLSAYFGVDHKHELYSVTKSFTSALIGAAIQNGLIDNVSQRVIDFFPNRTIDNMDSRKENLTLEHVLTMTSGLEWDEWSVPYSDPENDYNMLFTSNDTLRDILDRPMVADPGESWVYSSGGSHLLSKIVEVVSGMDTLDFANEFLFGPLNITQISWLNDLQSTPYGGHGLRLTRRDMAKFGYLYLNNGTWDGQQILPVNWTDWSSYSHKNVPDSTFTYGYQWWIMPDGIYSARGLYGQKIYVLPEYDTVVVFTADLIGVANPQDSLVLNNIIPSITQYSSLTSTTNTTSSTTMETTTTSSLTTSTPTATTTSSNQTTSNSDMQTILLIGGGLAGMVLVALVIVRFQR